MLSHLAPPRIPAGIRGRDSPGRPIRSVELCLLFSLEAPGKKRRVGNIGKRESYRNRALDPNRSQALPAVTVKSLGLGSSWEFYWGFFFNFHVGIVRSVMLRLGLRLEDMAACGAEMHINPEMEVLCEYG